MFCISRLPSYRLNLTKKEYREFKKEFYLSLPFDYVKGGINPYTNTVVNSHEDYEFYAHCFALKKKFESCVVDIESKFREEYEDKNIELSADLTSAKQTISFLERSSKSRLKISFVFALLFLLFLVLFFVRPSTSEYRSLENSYSQLVDERNALLSEVDDAYSLGYDNGYFYGSKNASSSASSSTGKNSSPTYNRSPSVSTSYIGNSKTKKFHRSSCSYLPDASNQVSLDTRDDAVSGGYSPCGHCNP